MIRFRNWFRTVKISSGGFLFSFFFVPWFSPVRKRVDHIISGSSSLTDVTEMDFKTLHLIQYQPSWGLIQRLFMHPGYI